MPSSTSSSERSIPRGHWPRAALMGIVLAVLVLSVWEMQVRRMGYGAELNDTKDLWAQTRAEVGNGNADRAIAIGSSRMLFDLDLNVYAKHFETERPLQLSLVGSKPLAVLEHVAADNQFRGTLLVGVSGGLYFVPQGEPVARAQEAIHHYERWSPSQRLSNRVGQFLQKRFAFLNNEDLTLEVLLRRTNLANRPGSKPHLAPSGPPYFAPIDEHRQARMWKNCTIDSPLAQRIQQIWLPLMTPPPPPPHMTPEEFKAAFMQSVQSDLDRTRAAVDQIRGRGGRVVFIRFPSSGGVRDIENKFAPRVAFWDRLIESSGTLGIHFEDYPELTGFYCPEWSHLTAEDATEFTRRLMPILERVLQQLEAHSG